MKYHKLKNEHEKKMRKNENMSFDTKIENIKKESPRKSILKKGGKKFKSMVNMRKSKSSPKDEKKDHIGIINNAKPSYFLYPEYLNFKGKKKKFSRSKFRFDKRKRLKTEGHISQSKISGKNFLTSVQFFEKKEKKNLKKFFKRNEDV